MAQNRQVGGDFDPDVALDSILGGGTTPSASGAAATATTSGAPPNRMAPIGPPVRFDASGVRLQAQSGQPAPDVPPGGWIITTFADGTRVKQTFEPGKNGGNWKQETIDPEPTVAQAYQDAVDKHNAAVAKQEQEGAAAKRSTALADQANARIAETMPAQKQQYEASAREADARTANINREQDYAKGPGKGLTPSESIAEAARLNQEAQLKFNYEIEGLRTKVEQGKLDVDVAKAKAQEIQNDIANKLAASTQALEANRIQSAERGQNMTLAGSLASTMGTMLNEERRQTVTPEESENLASARNWLANPSGPRPTFKPNTTQLPSNSDKIAAMVNQILAPRSPTAAAAVGATSGGMVAPPPTTNVNTTPMNVSHAPTNFPSPQLPTPSQPQPGAPPIGGPAPAPPQVGGAPLGAGGPPSGVRVPPVWNNATGSFVTPGSGSGPMMWDDQRGFVAPPAPAMAGVS
jgi:hypothetical protein